MYPYIDIIWQHLFHCHFTDPLPTCGSVYILSFSHILLQLDNSSTEVVINKRTFPSVCIYSVVNKQLKSAPETPTHHDDLRFPAEFQNVVLSHSYIKATLIQNLSKLHLVFHFAAIHC